MTESKGTHDMKVGMERLEEILANPDYHSDEYLSMASELRALRAAKPADGWQAIESAPKDVRIQVAWPQASYDEIPWAVQVARKSRFDGQWRSTLNGSVLPEQPTHWQPLPAAPQETSHEGK